MCYLVFLFVHTCPIPNGARPARQDCISRASSLSLSLFCDLVLLGERFPGTPGKFHRAQRFQICSILAISRAILRRVSRFFADWYYTTRPFQRSQECLGAPSGSRGIRVLARRLTPRTCCRSSRGSAPFLSLFEPFVPLAETSLGRPFSSCSIQPLLRCCHCRVWRAVTASWSFVLTPSPHLQRLPCVSRSFHHRAPRFFAQLYYLTRALQRYLERFDALSGSREILQFVGGRTLEDPRAPRSFRRRVSRFLGRTLSSRNPSRRLLVRDIPRSHC